MKIIIDDVMKAVRDEFSLEYIKNYCMTNAENYLEYDDIEEMEEGNYDHVYDYYKISGAGGNGIENDLITEIGQFISEKFGITEDEIFEIEDLRYAIDYFIKEFFPNFYFVDYREKTEIDKLNESLDNL